MALRSSLDDLETNGQKGDWCFLNDNSLIAIRFGEDVFTGMCILPIAENAMPGKPHWQWNGNKESPTLSPSILVHDSFYSKGWHGWLQDGKLITA